jgi:probable phosphoglycerate mutase
VCHGTIIRYTLAALAGRPLDGIKNGSISTLRLENGAWQVLTVNGLPLGASGTVDTARTHERGIAG